nr:MAG TPA: hypothetical protein [Caudoviricetes sp.]
MYPLFDKIGYRKEGFLMPIFLYILPHALGRQTSERGAFLFLYN